MRLIFAQEQEQLGQLVSAQLIIPSKLASPSKKKERGISTNMRLSLSASFLLISAYLASYNHSRTDVRLFAVGVEEGLNKKASPRKRTPRKTPVGKRIKSGDPQRLLGPKSFVLERLLAIYWCIRPEELEDSDSAVQSQVASLLAHRLIVRVSKAGGAQAGFEQLNGVKLKVNVLWEVVERLGKRLGFDVAQRMWDYEV